MPLLNKKREDLTFEPNSKEKQKDGSYFKNIFNYSNLEKPLRKRVLKQTLIGSLVCVLFIILVSILIVNLSNKSEPNHSTVQGNTGSSSIKSEETENHNGGSIITRNDGRIATFSITLKEFCKNYNASYEKDFEKQAALKHTIGGSYYNEISEVQVSDHIGEETLFEKLSQDTFLSFSVDERFKNGEDSSDSLLKQIGIFFDNSVDTDEVKILLKEVVWILLPNHNEQQIDKIITSLLTEQLGTSSYQESYKDDCFGITGQNNGIYNYFWLYADITEEKIDEYNSSSKREATDSEVKKALDVISNTDFKSDFGTYNLYNALSTSLSNGSVTGTVDWFGYTQLTFRGKDKGGMDAYVKYNVDTEHNCCMFLGSDLKWESMLKIYPN